MEKGFYSLGGYEAKKLPCPLHTSTNPTNDLEYVATSLEACVCEEGFTPADPAKFADTATGESKLRTWLRSNPEYANLHDTQVCVPCGRTNYKDTLGSQQCTPCPKNSFATTDVVRSKADCELCLPGYFQTGHTDVPCGECPDNHFCVGSETSIQALVSYAGAKTPCPAHTLTVPPNTDNAHPFKCM